MAWMQHKMLKVNLNMVYQSLRHLSKTTNEAATQKSVFISQSNDIFTNLALEDWLYRHFDFTNHHVLMLWQNSPCVVIGRHQNPWAEANISNLSKLTENGVKFARRNSGGGTVYHDEGNLNLTFFTPREHYNRKYNLEIIRRAIFREYGLKVEISKREDLVIRSSKISGTAAKLGRPNSYHHCTLLVDVNKVDLSQALQKPELQIKTKATKSVPSKIMNLCEENPKVQVQNLIRAIGWEYLRTTANSVHDGGVELANQQRGFQMINPTEQWFPGIATLKESLEDWEWCYGKTPQFTVSRSFPINHLSNDAVTVTLEVDKGIICDVSVFLPAGHSSVGFSGDASIVTHYKGQRFSEDVLNSLEMSLGGSHSSNTDNKVDLLQVMSSV